jgi:uncharacterized damage-inducible protein DinB
VVGPAVLETLASVSVEAATAHPIAGAHSIWEIVLHLTATYKVVLDRIGHRPGNLTPEHDWANVGTPDPERWRDAVETLRRLNGEVRRAMLAFPAHRLEQEIAIGHLSAFVHFAGLPQHDAYHSGQISLLLKAIESDSLR